MAACSDDPQPQPPEAQVAQAPAAAPATAPVEQADVASAEVVESADTVDPCDLSGYDMTKMTVDMHENLVKRCDMWKEKNL